MRAQDLSIYRKAVRTKDGRLPPEPVLGDSVMSGRLLISGRHLILTARETLSAWSRVSPLPTQHITLLRRSQASLGTYETKTKLPCALTTWTVTPSLSPFTTTSSPLAIALKEYPETPHHQFSQMVPRCITKYAPADPPQYWWCWYQVKTQVHTQVHARNVYPDREALKRFIRVEVLQETGELMRWKVRGFQRIPGLTQHSDVLPCLEDITTVQHQTDQEASATEGGSGSGIDGPLPWPARRLDLSDAVASDWVTMLIQM